VLLHLAQSPLAASAGTALIAYAALALVNTLHENRLTAARNLTVVGCLGASAVATHLLWPVALGRMPITQDHRGHLFRAWHFVNKRLLQGKLSGWSSDWFAGWPAGEDYPPGGDFWITLFRALTFPASWEASYAASFLAVYVVVGCSLIIFARPWGVFAGIS
jgi:uncharacterized membrane protein